MGKRKERRLAAKLAANRRVKLDIFAEPPSGDADNTSAHDKKGGYMDQDLHVSDPNSPSSSAFGRLQEEIVAFLVRHDRENPLQLLGQYSDDSDNELDVGTSKRTKLDAEGISFNVVDVEEPTENVKATINGLNDDKEPIDQVVTPEDMDGNDKNTDFIHVAADYKETDTNYLAADSSETSKLTKANETEISQDQNNCDLTGGWKLVMHDESNQYYYWNTLTGETSWEVPTNLTVLTSGVEGNPPNHDAFLNLQTGTGPYATTPYGTNSVIAQNGDYSASELPVNPSTLSNLSSWPISVSSMAEGHIVDDKEKDKHFGKSAELYGTVDAHASQLVKYCEILLQRLEVLDRSENNHLEDFKLIKKEIEIRLSDCNALSAYGSSLLPFWLHTETQIKQLESCISNGEAFLVVSDKHDNMLDATQNSPAAVNNYMQTIHPESEVTEDDKAISSKVKSSHNSPTSEACIVVSNQITDTKDDTTEGHLVTEVEPHTEDDIDMDIEMEVDEGTMDLPTTNSNSTFEVIPECPPLPPGEDWIPPPPPDSDEPVPPPPPPEEPSVTNTIMYPSYPEQYIGYAAPPFDYYSATSTVTGSDYYPKDAVTTSLPLSVNENHKPVAYYDISSGTIPCAPAVTTCVASGYYLESGPLTSLNNVKTSAHSVLAGSNVDTGRNISSKSKLNSELGVEAVAEPRVHTSLAAFVPSCTVSSETNVSNGSAMDTLLVASSKNKTKAVRKKKQTVVVAPSLRSSKIHGLVDKWKAAKEELHSEEDEEPATAYEALEKKRQKEIEQWKSQQIASGDARDNANFTPLGGDWRERVKRKRAKAKVEPVESPKETAGTGEKQPDLLELSKNLPAGWQAYWDESSKGVYYGNITTSETTWDRPSR